MTQREMGESFIAQIHNFDIDSEYEFQTHEINIFLTKAYREVVDTYYNNFEKSEKDRKILLPLVRTNNVSTITSSSNYTNGYSVSLESISPEVMYILTEEVTTVGSTNRIQIKPITLDAYTANKENPWKKPYNKLVWRLDVGSGVKNIYLISTFTPLVYYFTYLQQPEDIDITLSTSILINKEAHDNIVSKAVQLALQAKQISNNLKQIKD